MIGRLSLFLILAVLLVGGLHVYIWMRLFRDPRWSPRVRRLGGAALGLMTFAVPLAFLLRRLRTPLASLLAMGLFTWLGIAFLLVNVLAVLDLVRLILRLVARRARRPTEDTVENPSRRIWMARSAAGIALLAGGSATAAGMRSARGEVGVKEVPVKLPRLPRTLQGLTLVQITDLHVDRQIPRRFVEQVVERINALKPDLIALTGDMVDDSVAALADRVEPLGRLRARYGAFFVSGNHEYYAGALPWFEHMHALGIRPLRNERVSIGEAAGSIDPAGVDDFTGRPNFARAFDGRDPERELILLAHQPKAIHQAAAAQVGLQVSGHTHGGQIWPFGLVVMLQQPYLAGLYRHNALTQIYVSRGTGFWGPPIRLGAPAEITKFVLV